MLQEEVAQSGKQQARSLKPKRLRIYGANMFIQKAEERRRQLNRRAQKAFRERRTEHMAHLEMSMEHMDRELRSCHAARTSAVEELLMVKYKNSLLERLLMEKGEEDLLVA